MKSIFSSKMNWLNAITLVIAVLSLPQVTSLISASAMPYVLGAVAILNLILRTYFTSQPLTVFAASQTPPTA